MRIDLGKAFYLASAGRSTDGSVGLFLRKNKNETTLTPLGEAIYETGVTHQLQDDDIFITVPNLSLLLLLQEQLVNVGLLLQGWTRPNTGRGKL